MSLQLGCGIFGTIAIGLGSAIICQVAGVTAVPAAFIVGFSSVSGGVGIWASIKCCKGQNPLECCMSKPPHSQPLLQDPENPRTNQTRHLHVDTSVTEEQTKSMLHQFKGQPLSGIREEPESDSPKVIPLSPKKQNGLVPVQ